MDVNFLQVYPQYTIDAKYLAPTPGPNRMEDKGCMTGFFDSTILEDIEPPSGIFLLEMTRKDETKVNEFEAMAFEQQNFDFQKENIDMDKEEKSFKSNSSGSYIDFGQGIYFFLQKLAGVIFK